MSRSVFLDEVRDLTQEYTPNDDVAEFMATLDIVGVIGPSGVGKDTVINASGLPKVHSITTREIRQSELDDINLAYDFVDSKEKQKLLLAELTEGKLVQAKIHPTTGHFYGSRVDGYPENGGVTLFDVIPDEYYKLCENGLFSSVNGAYIVAPSYRVWQDRIEQAGNITNPDEYAKRMKEALHSLKMCLGDTSLHFLLNTDVQEAATELRQFAYEGMGDLWDASNRARQAARSMLQGLLA